jgi:acyl-CoA synthetase (AMP-forming)/AMP-acid ligase II
MIQFTSGSTGTPRGVMVTHGNLMHNLGLIQGAFGAGRRSRGVFWLPFYHDMGLIGGVLETIYCGGSSTFLSPLSFLQQPLRWLETISRTRATMSGGPNFAYEECIRRIDDEQLDSLDLSHWKVAFCGAEPIHRQTMEQFAEKFARCGFRRDALYCTYGMAEATLMISGGRFPASSPRRPRWSFSADRAEQHNPAAAPVSCGKPVGDVQAKIVDPDTRRVCKEGEIGEIWVATSSRGQGYWERQDETRETFHARLNDGSGPFLRTGDLGFLRKGELYVSGRLKDMIIIGGVNHYPQDIERTVQECHPLLGGGATAAFAIATERREGLAIVAEVSRQFYRSSTEHSDHGGRELLAKEIKTAIRQAIAQRHEVTVDAIVLVSPRTIPRTSSGKIRRRACREAYLEETLSRVDLAQ